MILQWIEKKIETESLSGATQSYETGMAKSGT